MTAKLGLYCHLGPLSGGDWTSTLAKAQAFHAAGVRHVFAANATFDQAKVAKGDAAYLDEWASVVNARLAELKVLELLSVGVRPNPAIAEQVRIELPGPPPSTVFTPDFTTRRTALQAVSKLDLLDFHVVYGGHEVHDFADTTIRSWILRECMFSPMYNLVFYYGHRGLWNKYGKDFVLETEPLHTVHVALNAAGATDASSGVGPGPVDCRANNICDAAKAFRVRAHGWPIGLTHAHINVTPQTTVQRMVAMLAVAREHFDVLMLRQVDDKGHTIHEPTPAMLEAIGEFL